MHDSHKDAVEKLIAEATESFEAGGVCECPGCEAADRVRAETTWPVDLVDEAIGFALFRHGASECCHGCFVEQLVATAKGYIAYTY